MGREASVAYFTTESEKCLCSVFDEKDDHCCDDKQDLLRLEDSQKTLPAFQLPLPAMTFIGALYDTSPHSQVESTMHFSPYPKEAQPPPKVLFELYCSFVFYDRKTLA